MLSQQRPTTNLSEDPKANIRIDISESSDMEESKNPPKQTPRIRKSRSKEGRKKKQTWQEMLAGLPRGTGGGFYIHSVENSNNGNVVNYGSIVNNSSVKNGPKYTFNNAGNVKVDNRKDQRSYDNRQDNRQDNRYYDNRQDNRQDNRYYDNRVDNSYRDNVFDNRQDNRIDNSVDNRIDNSVRNTKDNSIKASGQAKVNYHQASRLRPFDSRKMADESDGTYTSSSDDREVD